MLTDEDREIGTGCVGFHDLLRSDWVRSLLWIVIKAPKVWASCKQKHVLYIPLLTPSPCFGPSWDCKLNKASAAIAYLLNVPLLVIGCLMKSRLPANAWWAELSLLPYYSTGHYLNCYLGLNRLFWDLTECIRIIYTPLILHNSYFELTWRMDMHDKFACSKAFHCEKIPSLQ